MRELFQLEEFRRYYARQVATLLNFFSTRIWGDEANLAEVRGALELARRIIYLPLEIVRDESTMNLVNENLCKFKTQLVVNELEKERRKDGRS